MAKKQTIFKKIAILFAEGKNRTIGICRHIPSTDVFADPTINWFESVFEPTQQELIEYRHHAAYWLSSVDFTIEEDNEHRVLVCLFADILYREDVLGENENG